MGRKNKRNETANAAKFKADMSVLETTLKGLTDPTQYADQKKKVL